MSKSLALIASLACVTTGCGASIYEPPRDPAGNVVPLARRVEVPDSFWHHRETEAARTPPPERPRSISLGIAGQGKLQGGVGRDDPMPEAQQGRRPGGGMSWQEYASDPGWYAGPRGGYAPAQMGQPARRCRCDMSFGSTTPTVPPSYLLGLTPNGSDARARWSFRGRRRRPRTRLAGHPETRCRRAA